MGLEDEREMADATPFVSLPADAASGLPVEPPAPFAIGVSTFIWGLRTYVMGIVNATPDSFSGDGLLALAPDAAGSLAGAGTTADQARLAKAIAAQGMTMAEEGADLVDIGGESTRPGHEPIDEPEERRRILAGIVALHDGRPGLPISVDTRRASVAEAALAAGASMLNDVAAVTDPSDALFRVAAEHGVPIVLMHDRAEARYRNVVAEVVADLQRALDRAVAAGVPWERCIVDPGIGFGKTADQNLALLHDLAALRLLGRPVMLGTSRKSTIGRVLDLPAEERLEGTLATTALAVAAGVDIVRVHDVRANLRTARMADAIVRDHDQADGEQPTMTDRIVLSRMRFDGRHGVSDEERATPQTFEVDVELYLDLQPAGIDDDLAKTVDYSQVFELCRDLIESTNFRLLETIAEGIAHEILAAHRVTDVVVRVRKLRVPVSGTLDHAEVEIRRTRSTTTRRRRPTRSR